MEIDEKKIYTGKIIYWNYNYGFLECRDFDNNIYFHSKTLKPEMVKEIRLFDIFTFKIGISISEKNKGKIFAKKLKYKEKGNFSEYLKKIGVIYDWNGKFGFIDYPTEGKKIFLYNTRLLYIKNIINGDLIVFNPVKSTKDNSQLFAFFAYPIQFEKDILFLKQQYLNYQIPELKEYILSQQNSFEVLTNSDRFEIELINLDGKLNYINVEKLINDFKNNYKYIPDYDLLSRYISEIFLIQLWENNVIDIYDVELITKYFINTNTDTKKLIINKIKESDKEFILRKYFEHLKEIGKLKRVNNELKTFLGIIYKNEKNINQTLFQDTKEFLLLNLEPKDLINLWLNGFIDDLKESFIIENFDISNFTLIQQLLSKKKEYNELLMKIYEQYFFNLAKEKNIDFESEYPNLINYLHIFKENFEDRYKEIILLIELILKPYQKFILYLFDIEINFDAENYFNENQNEINHYFKVKYILKKPLVSEYLNSIEITQDNLQQFASNYNWNDLLNPIYPKLENKKSEKVYKKNHSFLHDIEEFNKLYQTKYNLRDLAEIIYNSIEKYTVIHIRLWLYVFQDKQHYDYIGFSVPFKALFNEEKKKIREIINFTDKQEEFESETEEVVPCEYIIEKDENTIIYNAHIENIYFGEGYLRLRLENKEYTDKYEKYFCGQELNRIPSNRLLAKV